MGWLQGAFTPEAAVWGPKPRHTARESDFMLQCTATPKAPAFTTTVIASNTSMSLAAMVCMRVAPFRCFATEAHLTALQCFMSDPLTAINSIGTQACSQIGIITYL